MTLPFSRAKLQWLSAALCVCLVGCASARDPRDPFEPFNRGVYRFNDTVDKAVLKPVAQGYEKAVPPPLRGGITSFFGNFSDVSTALNDALQGKFKDALIDVGRVSVNSTVGILGFFDVASRIGLQKHYEDFGQTLGVWGVSTGPYLVLPFLGPSTARDAVGLGVQYFTDPGFYLFGSPEEWAVFGVRTVNARANLLDTEEIFNAAAVDRYTFLRDAYLQRRRSLVYDSKPPQQQDDNTVPQQQLRRKTLKEMEEELEQE